MTRSARRVGAIRRGAAVAAAALAAACASTADELRGLAAEPPLDYAVLVTGGAFLTTGGTRAGTFAPPPVPAGPDGAPPGAAHEPFPIEDVLAVLRQGAVFQHVQADADAARRHAVLDQLRAGGAPELRRFLTAARDDGFDLLLVVEELQDGPIEGQGVNGRWPVTFATWILLGIGLVIPDHTFESRATLRVSVRDLQTGAVLYDPVLGGGPIELSLTERSDVLGLLLSILVPPFWVGSDDANVGLAVREITQRRLLLSLARDLKSEPVRQRLRERAAAGLQLDVRKDGAWLAVDAAESLSAVRLRRAGGALPPDDVDAFERTLLASMQQSGGRFAYRAALPASATAAGGRLQVLVGTIRGAVTSATFGMESP
jgi:hypothetical protein